MLTLFADIKVFCYSCIRILFWKLRRLTVPGDGLVYQVTEHQCYSFESLCKA